MQTMNILEEDNLKEQQQNYNALNKYLKRMFKTKQEEYEGRIKRGEVTAEEDYATFWAASISDQIDPVQYAKEWCDADLPPFVYTTRLRMLVDQVEDMIPDWVKEATGISLKYVAGIFTNFDNLQKLYQLTGDGLVRHEKERVLNILLDALMKDLSNVSNLYIILLQTGLITGKAAAVLNPVTAIPLAVVSWGAVAFSLYKFVRAARDYYDPEFGFQEAINNYEKLGKKIQTLNDDVSELQKKLDTKTEDGEIQKLYNKITRKKSLISDFLTQQEIVKAEAIAVAQVDNLHAKQHISIDLRKLFIASVGAAETGESDETKKYRESVRQKMGISNNFANALDERTVSDDTQRLVMELRRNKRDRMVSTGFKAVSISIMAVGLTVAACSLAGGQAAPAIFAVGVGITLVGGTMLGVQYFATLTVNFTAKRVVRRKEENALREKFGITEENKEHPLNQPPLNKMSVKMKLKYKLAFENSREKIMQDQAITAEKGHIPDIKVVEAAWYKALQDESKVPKKLLLELNQTPPQSPQPNKRI